MIFLTQQHIIGIIGTIVLIMVLGVLSGRNVKNASDFSTGGGNAGYIIMAGALIGTLIGGNSTIGTAESAFSSGMTAWWFTVGNAIGCTVFALVFIKPLRKNNCSTLQQLIAKEYGTTSGIVTSILNIIGLVMNIVAQILAANALLTTMFGISSTSSAFITAIIMIFYVVFGGLLGTGLLGLVKLVLVYIAIIFGVYKVINLSGGLVPIYNSLPVEQYFNMFSRGIGIDVGSAIAVMFGILCGQTYVQIAISGKDDKSAIMATLTAGIVMPFVGLGSVLIGMFMKINYPGINAGQAFPLFILENMPPLLGGAILATLLIALVGTGAGVTLGLSTILTNDIYKKFINKNADSKKELLVNRTIIIATLIISALLTFVNKGSSILSWGYLATGLRGDVLFAPLIGALFLKGKVDSRFAVASSILGISAHILCEIFLDLKFNTLFVGIFVSFVTIAIGAYVKKQKKTELSL